MIDLSLYEEVKLSGTFDLESITEENAGEYRQRLDDLIVALNATGPEEVPNIVWILCWTVCFNEFLQCLINNGYGMARAICHNKYQYCINNCGPIQA